MFSFSSPYSNVQNQILREKLSDLKKMTSIRATVGVMLPQHQGLILVAWSKYTNSSEVMTDFQTWYTFVPNLLTIIISKLNFSETRDLLVHNLWAKVFIQFTPFLRPESDSPW